MIPLDVLFGNPERTSPRISPDGTRLTWLAPVDDVLNVWLAPLDDLAAARPLTHDTQRNIRFVQWAYDGRHLLYLQDTGGDENWRVHAVDVETGDDHDLTPFDGVQARIVAVDPRFPHELLVALNRRDPRLHDLYRLDLRTRGLTLVEENPRFAAFVPDLDFVPRAALELAEDGSSTIHVRDEPGGEWRTLLAIPYEDALITEPRGFDARGRLNALSSVDANTARLVRIDPVSGETEVLAADDTYDAIGAGVDPETREPRFAVSQRERPELDVLDPRIADDVAAVREIDDGALTMVDHDETDRTWVVEFTRADGATRWYAFDRETKQSTFLFDDRPALEQYELAQLEPFSFRSRDGLQLHGYATFPVDRPRENLPTVLFVHGGPWGRDTWHFTPEAQWLASRGYLCVQVNFRGSTGYGKDFVNAGDREWGAKMHDDLLDTVEHVTAQGWADRERVAIMGGSYGGYAALVGATFTPDVFRCAIDVVGPSNLKTLLESIPPYWAPVRAIFWKRVGDPDTEADFLWSRSPLSRVDDIRIPILVVQGANDPRVKQAESEQIVAAMRDKGIEHDYLLFEDEGHGLVRPENRLRMYAAAEEFLARHLRRGAP